MNQKDILDSNELEKGHHKKWKEFYDTEILGDLWALKTEVNIDNIREKESLENILDTVQDSLTINNKKQKWEYTPLQKNENEETTHARANAWRISAVQNVKDNIQQYPWRLWSILKSIDKIS